MQRLIGWADRRWLPLVLGAWIVASGLLIWYRWHQIYWFSLLDTDDNLRILQVRDWLAGQGWYDLRQHRLSPPGGANIHWSRIVDLPIAGLRLFFGMLTDGPSAERAAVAVAPLLPLGVVLTALAVTARRLIGPGAHIFAVPIFFMGGLALAQFVPNRIDHHGWQLAMLAVLVAGLVDPRRARGGVTAGLATALSLGIGLEFLPYLGLAAGMIALFWVHDPAERPRLEAYAASLGGGVAAVFALFASIANRAPVCDALSPVWLSAALGGAAALLLLARLAPRSWQARLGVATLAAAILVGAFALAWPHCLGAPEGASPELRRLWLGNVREVKPILEQADKVAAAALALPIAGLGGALLLLWHCRRGTGVAGAAAVALLSAVSLALLVWQTRAGPGAQLLAVPGAAALAAILLPRLRAIRSPFVRVGGTLAVLAIASGAAVPMITGWFPAKPPSAAQQAVNRANARCPTIPALRPIARLPRGTVFTFVDLSPRLLSLTHHSAIAGPYHRNGAAIVDVMRAFRGSAEEARAIVVRRRSDYLLICPNMGESTLYSSQAPKGFYVQLRDGRVPDWLVPVALPKGSPFKMWRVVR